MKIETRYTWDATDIQPGVRGYFPDGVGVFFVCQELVGGARDRNLFRIVDRTGGLFSKEFTAQEVAECFTEANLSPRSLKRKKK